MVGKYILQIKYDTEDKMVKHIDLLLQRYPVLACCKDDILALSLIHI